MPIISFTLTNSHVLALLIVIILASISHIRATPQGPPFACERKADISCGCAFNNGSQYMKILLSDLNQKDGHAYFENLTGNDASFKYFINLCTGFNYPYSKFGIHEYVTSKRQNGVCKDVAGCQVSNDGNYLAIAKPSITSYGSFSSTKNQLQNVKYTTDGGWQMILFLTCDERVDHQVDPIQTSDDKSVLVKITSKYVCPQAYFPSNNGKSSGLSVGSVLVIIFFVVLVIYFVAGVLIMKYKVGASGKEIIPNVEFWSSLPGLMKDGCLFCASKTKGTCKKSNYEQI